MGLTANDKAWRDLCVESNLIKRINDDGLVHLSADDLRHHREPRLMAKIDHSENLPEILKDEGIGILPTSAKGYVLGRFSIFNELPNLNDIKPQVLERPGQLETLSMNSVTSESAVLHLASASGMVAEFLGKQAVPTVSGRMRTGEFSFSISRIDGGHSEINVNGAQIEIDGGFETSDSFVISEVKMHRSSDFNLRQLYYPYRFWSERISKDTFPIYLIYSNDTFYFLEYDFVLHDDYSSAELIEVRAFTFNDSIALDEDGAAALAPPELQLGILAPFPQADSFEKVIDLVNILIANPRTSDELASLFAFDARQSDYYFNAAKFLSLATTRHELRGETRVATNDANVLFMRTPRERNLEIARRINSFAPFRACFIALAEGVRDPQLLREVAEKSLADAASTFGLSGSTIRRRASTVLAWANWSFRLFGEMRG